MAEVELCASQGCVMESKAVPTSFGGTFLLGSEPSCKKPHFPEAALLVEPHGGALGNGPYVQLSVCINCLLHESGIGDTQPHCTTESLQPQSTSHYSCLRNL
jgi:hypothetical protein